MSRVALLALFVVLVAAVAVSEAFGQFEDDNGDISKRLNSMVDLGRMRLAKLYLVHRFL